MQQTWTGMPSRVGVPAARAPEHPVWRYALAFGLLSGLFGVLQVAITSAAALENHAAISSFYSGVKNQALDPGIVFGWLVPVLASAYGSCLVAFGFSMWLCWHAGRATALATGGAAGGATAGMLTSLIGSVCWIVASIAAVLVLHTDATVSGVLSTTPGRTGAHAGGELAGLLAQEVVGGLIGLGCGALAGRIGAGSVPGLRAKPPAPGQPLYAAFPPSRPGYPVAGWTMPSYPPPPEFYRGPAGPAAPSGQAGQPAAYPPGMPNAPIPPMPAPYPPYSPYLSYPPVPPYAPYPPTAAYPGLGPSGVTPASPPPIDAALPNRDVAPPAESPPDGEPPSTTGV